MTEGDVAVSGTGPDGRPTLVLVKAAPHRDGTVQVWVSDSAVRTPMPRAVRAVTDDGVPLRAAVLAHADVDAAAAAFVPSRVKWPSNMASRGVAQWWMLGAAVSMVAMVVLVMLGLPQVGLPLALLAGGMAILGRRRDGATNQPAAVIRPSSSGAAFGWTQMMPSAVLARIPPPEAAAGVTPAERVGVVQAAYGAKLSDIVYRIENSALFDASVPQTQRFQVALLAWDESSPDAASLADEVERSFDDARATAERVGLEHLPETARGPARRAGRAAVVALSDAPAAEREAAARRVAGILSSLALFYLPTVDPATPSLIGRRREIEPGR